MGLSKEYIQQALAQLEADIAQVPAPKDVEVLVPAFVAYGLPPVPSPFTPENGKVYVFEFLTQDIVIPLPFGVEPGFCFEVWGVECNNVGPYRLEVVAPGAQLVLGDCTFGAPPTASVQKFVIDGDGPSHEAVRFTYLGLVDFTAAGQSIFGIWKMERLDDKSDTTKFVHYATAAALPAHFAYGVGPDRFLEADGPGQLTIDGKTYSSLDREKILVKDEVDQGSNGVYWLIQVENPWRLRRASIDQNAFQVNRRGALYQVMFGTVNGDKQFYRGGYTGNITPVAGGGGGGTVQGTDGTYDIEAADEGTTAGNARGENSVDLCTKRSNAAYVPSGICSFNAAGEDIGGSGTHSLISGRNNYNNSGNYCSISGSTNYSNSGSYCSISGYYNYSNSGDYCSISGYYNDSNSGNYCSISGQNNHDNSGNWCSIAGRNNYYNAGHYCSISGNSAGYNALSHARVHGGALNARIIDLVAQIDSVGTGATELLLGGTGGTRIIIPDQSAWMFEVHFVAKTATGANAKMGHRTGVIVRDGASTTIGTVNTIGTDQEIGTTNATFGVAADDTNEALQLTVTASSGTVRCVARVHLTQVDY